MLRTSSAARGSAGSNDTGPGWYRPRYSMMTVASVTVRPASTRTGNFLNGHSAESSAHNCGLSWDNSQYSNGVWFSYSAVRTFWQ